MAILSFPAIAPNRLSNLTLPDYSLLVKNFDDGGEVRRSAQYTGIATSLGLSYQLMSAEDTATFITFWAASKGTWLAFTLPGLIISHPSNILIGLANLDSTTQWRFSEAIQFKTDYATLQRGLYSFDIKIQTVVS